MKTEASSASPARPLTIRHDGRATLVVRTYNEGRYLDEALSAAERCGDVLCEIVVVDSGSADDTLAIAGRHGARIERIAKEDFTFGRSLNIGCAAAQAEFLVFLSGHCIPASTGWLEHLLKPFADPSVALTYGRQVGGAASRFSESRVFEKYYPAAGPSQGPAFCNNANAAVRQSVWRRFRFQEDLTGLEDMALGRRVVEAGFRIAYCPEAAVVHVHHESWAQIRRRYEREAIALRHIHPEFHLTLPEAIACFAKACAGDWAALARRGLRSHDFLEVALYRMNQFAGSWLGNRQHREMSESEKRRYFYPSP